MAKAMAKTSKARTRRARAKTGLKDDALVRASDKGKFKGKDKGKGNGKEKEKKRTRIKVRTSAGGRAV